MRLKNKIALITGSTRGIGKGIALRFAEEGATVVINGTKEESVSEVVTELRKQGYSAFGSPFDVSNRDETFKEIERIRQDVGFVEILVNNAGISPKKDGKRVLIKDMSYQEWTRVIDVNLNGVFNCCQGVIPAMIEANKGKIVNISSSFARYYSHLATSHYITTKAAMIAFTHALCGELAQYGINCNALAPGRAWTDLTKHAPESVNKEFAATVPMKRFAEIDEIANATLFLSSEESSYINGATIDVNGGVFMS